MDEEVFNLVAEILRHIIDVLNVVPAYVVEDGDQFVVSTGFIGHVENANDAGGDNASGEDGFGENDEGVQRVSVFAECVVNVAVVGRVGHGGEEVAVEADTSGFVVNFVLVAGTLGDLDGNVKAHCVTNLCCKK